MLYLLWLEFGEQFPWLNVIRYLTFRCMAAFLLSFVLVLCFLPRFIRQIQRRGGQPIRSDGPEQHHIKKGTPTMGGAVVVASVLISGILLCDLTSNFVWMALFVLLGFGAIGFVDDWRKVTQQSTKGLSGRGKLFWQCAISAGIGAWLVSGDFSTSLAVPFFKEISIPLGLLFIPFVMLVVTGTSNAVNLTDGLDGLAIGPIMTVSLAYAVFAYLTGHAVLADYLGIPKVSGAGELSILLSAVVAGGLGFLWYNTFPAQIFMGDIGALALGGLLGASAIIVKHEIVLVVAGGVFVIEALSVMIQVASFKLTGRRVFRMAPIHHHFELQGWAEPKIIVRFWIVSIVLAILSLTTLKLR